VLVRETQGEEKTLDLVRGSRSHVELRRGTREMHHSALTAYPANIYLREGKGGLR